MAILGAGTIGVGWAAAFALRGWHVLLFDSNPKRAPDALHALKDVVRGAVQQPGASAAAATTGTWTWAKSIGEAVAGVEFVQECIPDSLELKRDLLGTVSRQVPADVPVASSTSAFRPSELQRNTVHGERILVGHPFHPVQLVPLVEVVGGPATQESTIARSIAVYEGIGKVVIRLRQEITGHLVNRLQAALFREAVHLVASGVATVRDVDRGIAYGPAVRWPFSGVFRTWHLAGGPGGARDYMAKFAPTIEALWRALGDATLSADVRNLIERQIEDSGDGRGIEELSAARDRLLVEFLEWLGSRGRVVP